MRAKRGTRRAILITVPATVAGAMAAASGLLAACEVAPGASPTPGSRGRPLLRVLVPVQEGLDGGDAGLLALQRAVTAIKEAGTSFAEVRAEAAPLLPPAPGSPGPPERTAVSALLAGLAASNTVPDLLYVHPANGAPLTPVWDVQVMAAQGLLAPLEPYLALEGQRLRLSEFLPAALEALRWGEALQALPTSARPVLLAYDPALYAAAAEPVPETLPGGLTWDRLREIVPRLVREPQGDGMTDGTTGVSGQQGLLVTPPSIVLAQLLLAAEVPLWDAAGTEPLPTPAAAIEVLRFWKALREPGRGTVPLPRSILGTEWRADRILAAGFRVAMGFTWAAPPGRAATGNTSTALRLVAPPRAARPATPLYVDGFFALPATAPDKRRSVQALGLVLDSLVPALPWAARGATPQQLATDPAIASVEEAQRALDARRAGHTTPLHAPWPLGVLQVEMGEPVETGRRTPEEAVAAATAALARERAALLAATAASGATSATPVATAARPR